MHPLIFQRRNAPSALIPRVSIVQAGANIWKQMENNDRDGKLTLAYALLRLLIDQRDFPGGLRGYSLYYLQRQGVFKTTVSRVYLKAEKQEQGMVAVGDTTRWKLDDFTLTDLQKPELDECYDDMLRFVKENS